MRWITVVTIAALAGFGLGTSQSLAAGPDARTCPARKALVARDIAYVDDPVSELQRLDLYAPARGARCVPAPIVVWVHGGGWLVGDKRGTSETKAKLFNDLGYVFVSVNYRLSAPAGDPGRPVHPAHADDVGAAVAWVEAHATRYGGDGKRIALLGHSAGAHLVALVGTDPSYVVGAGGKISGIRCVGSYDTASYDLVQRSAETQLVQHAFGIDEATLRDASPLHHLTERAHLPALQIAVRGTPDRQAAETAFAAAAGAAGGDISILDAGGLSHADVNRLIGAPGDTQMTPAVTDFVTGCLRQRS